MTKQQILDEIRVLTLFGMNSTEYEQGSHADLLLRITQIRQLVESEMEVVVD